MRIRWRNFELPSQVRLERETATQQYGRFVVEPFEKGFGTTIGNGLRRVLLSSIEGTAVTWVRIDGVVRPGAHVTRVPVEVAVGIRLPGVRRRDAVVRDVYDTVAVDVRRRRALVEVAQEERPVAAVDVAVQVEVLEEQVT